MIIRPARTDDLAPLSALARQTYADAFGHSFSAPDLAAHLAQHLADGYFGHASREDVFLLAEAEGRLIGFAQFGPRRVAVPAPSPDGQELRRHAQLIRRGAQPAGWVAWLKRQLAGAVAWLRGTAPQGAPVSRHHLQRVRDAAAASQGPSARRLCEFRPASGPRGRDVSGCEFRSPPRPRFR